MQTDPNGLVKPESEDFTRVRNYPHPNVGPDGEPGNWKDVADPIVGVTRFCFSSGLDTKP